MPGRPSVYKRSAAFPQHVQATTGKRGFHWNPAADANRCDGRDPCSSFYKLHKHVLTVPEASRPAVGGVRADLERRAHGRQTLCPCSRPAYRADPSRGVRREGLISLKFSWCTFCVGNKNVLACMRYLAIAT